MKDFGHWTAWNHRVWNRSLQSYAEFRNSDFEKKCTRVIRKRAEECLGQHSSFDLDLTRSHFYFVYNRSITFRRIFRRRDVNDTRHWTFHEEHCHNYFISQFPSRTILRASLLLRYFRQNDPKVSFIINLLRWQLVRGP